MCAIPETTESRPRLLIADEDTEIRSVLQQFLCARYECWTVGSPEKALALLSAATFDLLLCDITMRGMSRPDLLARAREQAPDTTIILLSGEHTINHAIDAMRAGAFDYLTKPFNLQHVEIAVGRGLEHHALLAGKRRRENHLMALAGERAAEIERTFQSLEEAYHMTLKALAAALEARDHETHGHSERVVTFSLRLGRELALSPTDLRALEFGALLHDIGKIGVPDAVLHKPNELSEEEWVRMRRHPIVGARILSGIDFLAGAARVVAEHHERWDGTGYPRGLRGAEIDLGARIFAVADAFDAITSERVYRAGRSYEAALVELETYAGKQFDPAVITAFRRVPPHEWEIIKHRTVSQPPDCLVAA